MYTQPREETAMTRRLLTMMIVLTALLVLATMAWATGSATITGADNLAAAVKTTAPTTSLHVATPAPPKTAAVATTEPTIVDTSGRTAVAQQHEVAPDTRKSVADKYSAKVVAYTDVGGGLGSVAKA